MPTHEICDFAGTSGGAEACVKGPCAASSRTAVRSYRRHPFLGSGRRCRESGSDLGPGPLVPRILVADPLAEDGLERLRRAGEVTVVSKLDEAELIRRIPEFDALVVRSETRVTALILEAGRKLRVVGRAGVGVDNIDVPAATAKGILVVNAPRARRCCPPRHT